VLAPLIDLGVEAEPLVAPEGWQAVMDRLPEANRTIIGSCDWEPEA
jgi:hypothetical protein